MRLRGVEAIVGNHARLQVEQHSLIYGFKRPDTTKRRFSCQTRSSPVAVVGGGRAEYTATIAEGEGLKIALICENPTLCPDVPAPESGSQLRRCCSSPRSGRHRKRPLRLRWA